MSNCNCAPCAPAQLCQPENFGLLFPSLVGPAGPAGGPGTYVTNFALLRLLDATIWPEGYAAVVGGYDDALDGGGGTFIYSPAATEADNNGTILAPSNGIGRWFRQYTGPVSVRWFGAVGDGLTDDTAALQGAIDFVESLAVGGSVFMPAAIYLISAELTITGLKSFIFYGEGWGSVIKTTGVINGIFMGDGSTDNTVLLRLLNFAIDGDGDCEIAVSNNRLHQTIVSGLYITGTTVAAIDMNMAYDNEIANCTIIDHAGRGIIVDENNENTRIYDCRFELIAGVAVHFRNGSCDGSKVINNQFIQCGVGLQVDAGSVEDAEGYGVIGNYFKDMVGANCLFGTDASTHYIVSLLFQNNVIKAGGAGPTTNSVEFDRCAKPVVTSNMFISADFITSVTVTGLVEFGNSFAGGSAEPTVVQLGNASGNLSASLPTADPAVPDELWSDSNVVTVSV